MKAIGKIGALIITFMVVASIFLFINIETYGIDGGMRFRAFQLLLIIGIPWFISYSKWANDNIWNTKTSKPTNTPNTSSEKVVEPIDVKETSKEVNKNLNPNNNNTLLYVIIGILVIILITVLSNPESQQTNSNKRETVKRETIEREKIPRETITRKEIETNPVQVEQRVKPKSKPKPKSAWFNSDNDDPFAQRFAYTNGAIKSYEYESVFEQGSKPKIKISELEPYGAGKYENWKIVLTGLKFRLQDSYYDYDDYSYSYRRQMNRLYDKSDSQKETAKRILQRRGKPDAELVMSGCETCRCSKNIVFTIAFQPSGKSIVVSNEISLNVDMFMDDEFQIGSGLISTLEKNSELINLIKTNNKMFIRPSISKTCWGNVALSEELPFYRNYYDLMYYDVKMTKSNYPGLFSGKPYLEFNLSGSSRAISNAKIHQGTRKW